MKSEQRNFAVVCLFALAVVSHLFFCTWRTTHHTGVVYREPIVSFGDIGIFARKGIDDTAGIGMGILVPLALAAAGMFFLLGSSKKPGPPSKWARIKHALNTFGLEPMRPSPPSPPAPKQKPTETEKDKPQTP